MLKEIIYWTSYFFEKNNRLKKGGWHWSDSIMFVSLCLFLNILSIIYIVEYYTHFKILKYIPITTKWELISWVWAILILLPFIIYIYVRYYKPPKLSNLKLIYESKSNIRLILGRLFYVCYCLITWIVFFIIVGCFKH